MKKTAKSDRNRTKAPSAGELLRTLLDIWQSGETSGLKAILHKDVVYEDIPNEHVFSGLKEVAGYIEQVHSWAVDFRIDVKSIESGPKMAVCEWIMFARQGRPMGARIPVATNRRIRLRGMTLVLVSRGRITRATDFLDALTLMRQLGGQIELPGGGSLGPLSAT